MGQMNEKKIELDEEQEVMELRNKPLVVKDEEWKSKIKQAFAYLSKVPTPTGKKGDLLPRVPSQTFTMATNEAEHLFTVIWAMSQEAFDYPREVQVMIDDTDELFISVGTPSFVSFKGQDSDLPGMKLPIKCWIHTHPFGVAYFSGTDWKSINTWRESMFSAVVLGDNQYWTYKCDTSLVKQVKYGKMSGQVSTEEKKLIQFMKDSHKQAKEEE